MSELKAAVKEALVSAVTEYLRKKGEPKSTHVILDRIFPQERRIRSIIGGLETSLGTMLWENIANSIAKANNFNIKSPRSFEMPLNLPSKVHIVISKWTEKRGVPNANIGLTDYVAELRSVIEEIDRNQISYVKITKGDGIDLWLERNGIEYAMDIKTVQGNAKNGNSFNSTLMNWYAYRLMKDPSVLFEAKFVFPYCPWLPPTVDTWWAKMKGRIYPLKRSEDVLVQDEFWDFLTGEPGSWQHLLDVFDELGRENFGQQFYEIFYPPQNEQ